MSTMPLRTIAIALGLVVGQLGSLAIRYAFPPLPAYAPTWSVTLSILVAVAAGVLFSLLPARRAARLDPVMALSGR